MYWRGVANEQRVNPAFGGGGHNGDEIATCSSRAVERSKPLKDIADDGRLVLDSLHGT